MSGIKIRTVPANANPTPRPMTSYARPGTASARPSSSCGLTGLPIPNFNVEDESKSIFENVISENYILKLYPDQNPSDLHTVSLIVDTSYQSLLDLGDIIPNLSKLYLDNSKLLSVRDLGTSIRSLQILSLNNCGLTELDGIAVLSNLKCLYARDNLISDINALAMHEFIEELDLHGNKITDISIGDILSTCSNLKKLYLTHNPISRAPNYRLIIAAMIPQIEFLDSMLVDHNAKNKISNGMILEAASAMQLEQEELDDERRMEMAILGDEFNTAMGFTPMNDSLPANDSDHSRGHGPGVFPDTGSDLTHGSAVVLAGNMATAMRRRRQTTQPKEKCSASESSALAALDSALVKGTKKEREFHMPFFGEGDITSLVLQSCGTTRKNDLVDFGSLSPLSLVNRQKSNSNILSTSFDAEIGSLDKDDDCFGSSLAISKCDEFPRPNSRGLSPNYLRSPSPRSTRSRNGLPPSSPPVQRNASRPSSSRSSLVSGIASTTPSAPFKVLVPASLRNEKDEFLTRLAVSERANISRNEGTPKSKHMSDVWDVSDDSSDDETNEIVRHTKRSGQLSTKEKADQTRNDSHQETEKLSTTATDRLVLERGNKNGVADAALRNAKSNTLANVAGRSLGFDLKGSLAAINQWVEEMDSEEDDDSNPQLRKISGFSGSTSISTKILSRDSIINMCIRGDDNSTSNDSEEIADTSEAYEENDILFFDNHLHRSTDGDSNFCPVDESAKLPKLSKSSATRLNLSPHVGTHTSVNKQEILFEETSSTPSDSAAYPRALLLSDETLISMLSLPPKTVPQMRTKSSFQDFFRGIPEERMKRLLHRAYGNLNDLEREVKVKKRMELLAGVLTNV